MPVDTETIWRGFSDRLRQLIDSKVARPEDAQDILQDVFYKIHSNIAQLKHQDRVDSWVFQITRNAVSDFYRKRAAEQRSMEQVAAPVGAIPEVDTSPKLKCLQPVIAQLPEKYREAIRLTEFEGLSQKELAERLGISLSGAKSRVQRAREKIKDILLACCHFDLDRRGNIMDFYPHGDTCLYCSAKDSQQ